MRFTPRLYYQLTYHYREHISLKHRAKKSSPFKFSDCQGPFDNEKLLKDHNETVDCEIKCPECPETFDKTLRTSHQENRHPQGSDSVVYKEVDDAKWQVLKNSLKKYTDSLRREGEAALEPELKNWVAKNTARYNKNRKDPKPLIDLGQWYIAFRVER